MPTETMEKEYRGMKIRVFTSDADDQVFSDIVWFSISEGCLQIKTQEAISVYPLASVITIERWWERPDSYPVKQSVPFEDWSEYGE